MKLPARRLNAADYREADWLTRLVSALNLQRNDLTQLLNGQLVLGDNVNGQLAQLSFTTPADYATGGFPSLSFQTQLRRPTAVLLGNVQRTDDAPILTPTSLTWSFINSTEPARIRINYVAGLVANQTYNISVVVL